MSDSLLDEGNDQPAFDPNKNYLVELVGEGKKFKTAEDLAKGKYEADLYVETIKRSNDELRADYLKLREENMAKAKLEELIQQLDTLQKTTTTKTPVDAEVSRQAVIDPKQVESLVDSRYEQIETLRKQDANSSLIKSKLTERYGSNYSGHVKSQIDSLGISEKRFNEMARTEPQVLIKALGLDTKPNVQDTAPPRNNRRSDNFAPQGTEKRTWSYYQRMKKENPTRYYDPKTNVEIHNDAVALGEEFKDGDFND